MNGERPPRVGLQMAKRFVAGAVTIFVLTAAATAAAGLLKVKDVVDILRQSPKLDVGHELTAAEAGQPQTILVLGSDKRWSEKEDPGRSDTIMLVRLDPNQQATALMSIPRDLKVNIAMPGGRVQTDKINAAYAIGGPRLTLATVKDLLGITINHVVNINFGGFRRAVDYIGCVYSDIDRRYYHSNAGLPAAFHYAEIDVRPGYQKLCGQKALDYVRFRHTDSDIVRGARQQDFLRDAKDQVRRIGLLDRIEPLTKIVGRYTQTDIRSESALLRLLKLAAFSAGHPVREVHFPAILGGPESQYVTVDPEQLRRTVHEFMHARASGGPRKSGDPNLSAPRPRKPRKKRPPVTGMPGLVQARSAGENQAILIQPKLRFPVYFPTVLTASGQFASPDPSGSPRPRTYDIRDPKGRIHRAYRMVIAHNPVLGQYYGVQGMDWTDPPILEHPSEQRKLGGRKFDLFYDGTRLRLVALRTPQAVYWVSNTLTLDLTNPQMLAIARSLAHFGRG